MYYTRLWENGNTNKNKKVKKIIIFTSTVVPRLGPQPEWLKFPTGKTLAEFNAFSGIPTFLFPTLTMLVNNLIIIQVEVYETGERRLTWHGN